MKEHLILGIDIGGTGIKGGIVNTQSGEMVTERYRLDTPKPATPSAVAATFRAVVEHFEWSGDIGVGFPAIIHNGVAKSASNIDKTWINTDIAEILSAEVSGEVFVLNDADAAGIAVQRFDSSKTLQGVVLMLTIGTGIGSALFVDGRLVPNTELGHLYLQDQKEIVEKFASNAVRKKEELSWEKWGRRFNKYLQHIEHIFSPDVIILGGGASKRFENFKNEITINAEVRPTIMGNHAGTIGAACYALTQQNKRAKVDTTQ